MWALWETTRAITGTCCPRSPGRRCLPARPARLRFAKALSSLIFTHDGCILARKGGQRTSSLAGLLLRLYAERVLERSPRSWVNHKMSCILSQTCSTKQHLERSHAGVPGLCLESCTALSSTQLSQAGSQAILARIRLAASTCSVRSYVALNRPASWFPQRRSRKPELCSQAAHGRNPSTSFLLGPCDRRHGTLVLERYYAQPGMKHFSLSLSLSLSVL